MSQRHVIRKLADGRWVCGARGCKFTDPDMKTAVTHALAPGIRVKKAA